MPDPDTPPGTAPDLQAATVPLQHTPRPGAPPSQPSASNSAVELPYPEELQVLLGTGYVVENFLGQGGMGAVYKGLQMPLRRPVAIKILQKRQAAGEEDDFAFEERFKREAYAMAALTHPHIVQVYDCGDAGENFLFISMELVEGGDLSDAIKAGLSPEAALKLIPQICDGLQAAHERGIVHRDIKPANIFLTKDGRAKVADFGLAKKFDVKNTLVTKAGLGMGTPDYAAPEQYDGVEDIDHRADIYSFGVMMYQMLTGVLPRGNFKPASQRAGVDPRIDAVLGKAMENDRADRHQSTAEIKAALAAIAAPTPKPATQVALPAESAPPQTSKPRTTPTAPRAAVPSSPTSRTLKAAVPAEATKPTQKKSSSMGVLMAVIGVVAALAAFGWFMFKPKPSSPSAALRGDRSLSIPLLTVTPILGDVQPTPAFASLRKKGGRLRVEGTLRGTPVDISSAESFSDLVGVYAGYNGWLAKRAGGQSLIWGLGNAQAGASAFSQQVPDLKQVSRSCNITVLTSGGGLNAVLGASLRKMPQADSEKSVHSVGAWDVMAAFDKDGVMTAGFGLGKDQPKLPPADFFRGAVGFTASESFCVGYFQDRPPRSWVWRDGTSYEFPAQFSGCIDGACKGGGLLVMRDRAGKVLVCTTKGTAVSSFPPPGLPPAIQVRAGRDVAAAQLSDGTWRAWGTDGPVLQKVNRLGVAIDLDMAPDCVIWIAP